MKERKIPERMCIGCSESFDKRVLVRIVKNKSGEIFIDETGKANGRGAYICRNRVCLEKAVKSKRLAKAFGCSIPDEIYDKLRGEIDG